MARLMIMCSFVEKVEQIKIVSNSVMRYWLRIAQSRETRSSQTLRDDLCFRWDAIKTCVLMPLLCIMWSCAFVWFSGIPLMAWLFAASCIIYGAATLILRCFYHTEEVSVIFWSIPHSVLSVFNFSICLTDSEFLVLPEIYNHENRRISPFWRKLLRSTRLQLLLSSLFTRWWLSPYFWLSLRR